MNFSTNTGTTEHTATQQSRETCTKAQRLMNSNRTNKVTLSFAERSDAVLALTWSRVNLRN